MLCHVLVLQAAVCTGPGVMLHILAPGAGLRTGFLVLVFVVGLGAPSEGHTLFGVHFVQVVGALLHGLDAGGVDVEEVAANALGAGELVGAVGAGELAHHAHIPRLVGARGAVCGARPLVREHVVLAAFAVVRRARALQAWVAARLAGLATLRGRGARRTRAVAEPIVREPCVAGQAVVLVSACLAQPIASVADP